MAGHALLKGNGMIFRSDVLLKEGYASDSIAEDLDFSYHLIEKGYRIGYTAKTSVYGDMPEGGKAFEVQHRRWEGGRGETLWRWFPRLMKKSFAQGRLDLFFLGLDLSLPPMVPLMVLMGLLFPVSILTGLEWLWVGQIILVLTYLMAAPRWHMVCYPNGKDIFKIGKYLWLKTKIMLLRLLKGDPKTFVRTPRAQPTR